jgi:hypothetical protein
MAISDMAKMPFATSSRKMIAISDAKKVPGSDLTLGAVSFQLSPVRLQGLLGYPGRRVTRST